MQNPICSEDGALEKKTGGAFKAQTWQTVSCLRKAGPQREADWLEIVGLVGVETLGGVDVVCWFSIWCPGACAGMSHS